MDSRFLFIRLADDVTVGRHWNANDETAGRAKEGGRTWHGFIPKKDNPMDIALSWRTDEKSPPRPVGSYRLDLTELLKAEYIRADSSDGTDGFRVMFVHAKNDCIYLQKDPDSPRLIVGCLNERED